MNSFLYFSTLRGQTRIYEFLRVILGILKLAGVISGIYRFSILHDFLIRERVSAREILDIDLNSAGRESLMFNSTL